ncbi:putative Actin A [Blattamonas nauphoetae]|uniref:Actin A n=1 Tax=Blattamonas nauphoetae TaxID=2049346 RepID=A0ABQ9XQJ3_9EUKA|nr:putative Actin A [Blattamonas nauphoetae]
MSNPAAIIDVGTGYTKMGLSTNTSPQYIIPTMLGERDKTLTSSSITKKQGLDELDFLIGDEAFENQKAYPPTRFMDHAIVADWDKMEKFYEQCYYRYLRINPEEHPVILTEPPLNTPENREYLAEVMFETFNVPGMYIAVQAVLAMCSTWISKSQTNKTLTGTVIDSGDGVTHIIPVSDGSVIPSAIKHIPIAGGDLTKFILDNLRERGEQIPQDEMLTIARTIKEQNCYVTSDIVKEYNLYDQKPDEFFKTFEGINRVTKKPFSVGVGYERFLAPEVFFNPNILSADYTVPVPMLVDQAIQQSPIDCRRPLYGNICLSGGSTMFKHFDKRMQKEIQKLVNERLDSAEKRTGAKPTPIDVKVIGTKYQRFAVFFGGSMIASSETFPTLCKTKAQYDEYGPAICRTSATFSSLV